MTYKFTAPAEPAGRTWKTITLVLPPDTLLALPKGRWKRENGHIVTTYTRDELELAMRLALLQKRSDLEARLQRGLVVLSAVGASDEAEAERLLAHWDTLNAEYTRLMAAMQAIGVDISGGGGGD